MIEISRNYEMINKTTTGEIITIDLNRKNEIRVFVLTPENPEQNASAMKKFESIEELLNSFSFEYEWFKNSDYCQNYEFTNLCYFTEKSRYGEGADNRKKSK